MAFTPGDCAAAVAAILNGLPGITDGLGQVHTRRRIVRDEAAVKTLLAGTGGKVNGWMIYPAAANTTVSERSTGFNAIGQPGGGQVMTTFQFNIDGYYQIDDAAGSEETFRDLAWSVADTLNSYGMLSIPGVTFQLPADVEAFGFIMLAGLGLYHYAKIGVGFRGRTRS